MPTTPTPAVKKLAVLVAVVLLLTACGSEATTDAPGGANTKLDVIGTDRLEFQPGAFTVPAGVEVTVSLTAGETVDHDFIIEGAAEVGDAGQGGHGEDGHGQAGHDTPLEDLAVAHADRGEAASGTFVIDEPGAYTVYCSVPGHRQAGMEATLTVLAGS